MTALVIVQVISGVALGAISFFPALHKPGGCTLSPRGWLAFGLGTAILVASTASIQTLNARDAIAAQERLEQLMQTIARTVMTPSKGPALPVPAPTGQTLRIHEPPSGGATVDSIGRIRGQVSDSRGQVWVIVHPLGTSSYWVQPRISVGRTGDWQVTGYFGRSGPVDAGKLFEVLAVADPATELTEGAILEQWPSARLVSDVVTVRRR
ncbi:MAG: hypothetical protein ACXW5U_24655 [Thermoanaerobaculia bacterium]